VTTSGPNLQLQIKSWGTNCVAKIGGVEFKPVAISECNFLLTQQQGSFEPVWANVTGCLIKIPGAFCEIQIPAGMESATPGKGINVGLKKTVITNEATHILSKLTIEESGEGQLAGKGIFGQSVGNNALCSLPKSTEEATLVGLEVRLEEIKAT
jgi:hypothetical protein